MPTQMTDPFLLSPANPMFVGGACNTQNPSTDDANVPAGEPGFYVFGASFEILWNGQTLHFDTGVSYQLDSALRAAITAAGQTPVSS